MTILVTGAAGFIGSNFVSNYFFSKDEKIVSLDALTYAGDIRNLSDLNDNKKHIFIHGDILDESLLNQILLKYKPRAVLNFAAETHVDKSIDGPEKFIKTNIFGTFRLINSIESYWSKLEIQSRRDFRFLQISTDEVYGSLYPYESSFTEHSLYKPRNPYAASKASADHIVNSYFHTFGLPSIIVHCTNNYGPRQFAEKLIPLCILNAINNRPIPIYGDGLQIRDWIHVNDNCSAIKVILERGNVGEIYNVSARNEKTNLELLSILCNLLDNLRPRGDGKSYRNQIKHIKDRVGHDRRYAVNPQKIESELGWKPSVKFEEGLRETIMWYLENMDICA